MKFMTADECRAWATGTGLHVDDSGEPRRGAEEADWHSVSWSMTPVDYRRLTWFCRHIESSLQPRGACLMWVTDWWDYTAGNLHLYYRLRQSYRDMRQLDEAPGHYFLNYEGPDLVSFLEVAILNDWDVHLLPLNGFAKAFVNHDGFVDFASSAGNGPIAEEFLAALRG